jgi:prophage antirepressor-like protein
MAARTIIDAPQGDQHRGIMNSAHVPLVFTFDGATLRGGLTVDKKVYLVAADVGHIFNRPDVAKELSRLDVYEKDWILVATSGGDQHLPYVSESGVFTLLVRLRPLLNRQYLEHLRKFRVFLTDVGLPAIRAAKPQQIAAPEPSLTQLEGFLTLPDFCDSMGIDNAGNKASRLGGPTIKHSGM